MIYFLTDQFLELKSGDVTIEQEGIMRKWPFAIEELSFGEQLVWIHSIELATSIAVTRKPRVMCIQQDDTVAGKKKNQSTIVSNSYFSLKIKILKHPLIHVQCLVKFFLL